MELYGYPVGDLVVLLVIAVVGGAIVQWFAGYSPGGCLISLAFAFLGAWLASWLDRARSMASPPGPVMGPGAVACSAYTVCASLRRM